MVGVPLPPRLEQRGESVEARAWVGHGAVWHRCWLLFSVYVCTCKSVNLEGRRYCKYYHLGVTMTTTCGSSCCCCCCRRRQPPTNDPSSECGRRPCFGPAPSFSGSRHTRNRDARRHPSRKSCLRLLRLLWGVVAVVVAAGSSRSSERSSPTGLEPFGTAVVTISRSVVGGMEIPTLLRDIPWSLPISPLDGAGPCAVSMTPAAAAQQQQPSQQR